MKIPNIHGAKGIDGKYRFFLPSLANPHEGATYDSDDAYVAAFLAQHSMSTATSPRCANPLCNRRFNPTRGGQTYCERTCAARHNARRYYRELHGIPDDPPVVRTDESTSAVERDLRAALARCRAEIDARPAPPLPRLLPENLKHLQVERDRADAQSRRDRERAKQAEYDAFVRDLRASGYDPEQHFWKDQLLDLFEVWGLDRGLPSDLTPYVKSDTI